MSGTVFEHLDYNKLYFSGYLVPRILKQMGTVL